VKDKVCGYYLDVQQENIVLDESQYLLVVAGAGSGKTLTILGKINYLIKYKNILPNEILCISFTRASANSLKEKILKEFGLDMFVYTFHKLSLEILKENNVDFDIADSNTLENIIHEFFLVTVLDFDVQLKNILQYFNIKAKKNIKKQYNKFYKYNYEKIKLLEKLIFTFLHLFKCNNFAVEDFKWFLFKIKKQIFKFNKKKEIIFLLLSLNVYLLYQKYLEENKEIDFDDMIINTTKEIKEKGISTKYKYIIIDEYQIGKYLF
jgi:DNA helicase-4